MVHDGRPRRDREALSADAWWEWSEVRGFVAVVVLALMSAVGLTGLVGLGTPPAGAAPTAVSAPQTGFVVNEEPAQTTPSIVDGTVNSITQVGNQVIVGGSFTQVRDPGSSTTLTRNHLLAFDASTGVVSPTFNPAPDGVVHKVQAASDGTSVYVGGHFSNAGGRPAKYLFRASAASGGLWSGFRPVLDNDVRDLEVVGSRLWVAGKFSHVGTRAQRGLATLGASNGAYDAFFTGVIAGLHNPHLASSRTDVLQISANRADTRLVAVGNFTTVNGAARAQIMKLDIGGTRATLSPWRTTLYTSACSSVNDTNMSDVEFSPNGLYFVVSSVGAYGVGSTAGTSGCDVVARFQSSATSLSAPVWTAYTGGDSTWTVEVTENVVYVGGHQRWQNNPTTADAPGQGAVDRRGIAALDPVNGMAYSWNPSRNPRGVGVQDMMATDKGLYVGSDTDNIGHTAGNTLHPRIAFLPLSGGKQLATVAPYPLPADVYTVARAGSQLVLRSFDGTHVTSTFTAPNGPGWDTTVGAFMINGVLYTATSDGVLSRQTFDGTTYGSASPVTTADALTPQTDWHTTDVPAIQSLFYYNGRIFFTRAGDNLLYTRAFEPEDDIVGQQRFSSPAPSGVTYATMYGAFVAGGRLYYANTSGRLFRASWSGTGAVAGTAVQVSGPGKDGENWASRAMFVRQ
jgi:hypothetical protein